MVGGFFDGVPDFVKRAVAGAVVGLAENGVRQMRAGFDLPDAAGEGGERFGLAEEGLRRVCEDVRVGAGGVIHARYAEGGVELPLAVQKGPRDAVVHGFAFKFLPHNLGGETFGWALHRNHLGWGSWQLFECGGGFLALKYLARVPLAALTPDLVAEAAVMVGGEQATLHGRLQRATV